MNGRYFADSNGLDAMEKDILIENELCGNKGNGKTPIFAADSTNKSTVVECIGHCCNFCNIVLSNTSNRR